MLASAVMPATAQIMLSLRMYSFSADVSCSKSFEVTFRSAASTMPSLARMPMAVPAWEMASRAYSTWYRRPSGEKIVVYRDKWFALVSFGFVTWLRSLGCMWMLVGGLAL